MNIVVLTVSQLREQIRSRDFWLHNIAPVTRHRAQFIVNNPRAEDGDPVLLIAWEGENIVGYRVVFPDRIYIDGKAIKIGWGSSSWVDKRYRGKGIGRMLFEKSYELWNGNTGSLIQSDDAARVYLGNPNFYCLRTSLNYQFVLRLNSLFWVEKKARIPAALSWLFALADAPVNFIVRLRQSLWSSRRKPLREIQLEYCHEISDPETVEFIKAHNNETIGRKEAEDLNAIVKYPTSLPTPLGDYIGSRYYFATKSLRFEYMILKVYDKNMELIGVMLMNLDGPVLKLLYYYYKSGDGMRRLFDIFLQHAVKMKSQIISSYDDDLNDYLIKHSGFPMLYKRKHTYRSFMSNRLQIADPGKYKIYDGDGG